MIPLTLLIPQKPDPSRAPVAQAWQAQHGPVLSIAHFWEKPTVDPKSVRLYGHPTFCLVLAEKLRLRLLTPADDLLTTADPKWLSREAATVPLKQALTGPFPMHFKPVIPRQFAAGVYPDAAHLQAATEGLDPQTPVFVSPTDPFTCQVRAFLLHGQVATAAIFSGQGSLEQAKTFIHNFAKTLRLPVTLALDVALLPDGTWVITEPHPTWSSAPHGCDPQAICQCLIHSLQ